MSICRDILLSVGDTSMVRFCTVVPPGCARIVVKLERENPTVSMKERAARAMISSAEEDGRSKPADTIVEAGGSPPA